MQMVHLSGSSDGGGGGGGDGGGLMSQQPHTVIHLLAYNFLFNCIK